MNIKQGTFVMAGLAMCLLGFLLLVKHYKRERAERHAQEQATNAICAVLAEASNRVADALAHAPEAWHAEGQQKRVVSLRDMAGDEFEVISNVVGIVPNHDEGCTLVQWISQDGRTNDFHAWACRVVVLP